MDRIIDNLMTMKHKVEAGVSSRKASLQPDPELIHNE
jgi:hypothetical protein